MRKWIAAAGLAYVLYGLFLLVFLYDRRLRRPGGRKGNESRSVLVYGPGPPGSR